ncbi:MAG: exonuclease [Flavobacterium sp.]|nr:MAG: exonuclease [Flavobacterium sp.]
MNIIKDMEQGSEAWKAIRLGKVTASKMKDLMSNGRGSSLSKMSETYMMDLIAERLTGESKPFFENDAMKWGTETEPQARAMFELREGLEVETVAFIEYDDYVGMSPDGLIGDDGLIEIKCPNTATQIKRALSKDYAADYKDQIQMQLWVSNRKYCYFLSFDPRLDCAAGYLLQKVERDEDYINKMRVKTAAFVIDMNEILSTLKGES